MICGENFKIVLGGLSGRERLPDSFFVSDGQKFMTASRNVALIL